ncbi:multiple epidermal growth factor-like domains protein 10 [Saccostrea cucullata]|uniref:multiple epidermal growth factor-like domains protein 10 n=1 Tax=Saccostrea cuccullata TaxID=36930 RepID=UPI002ED037C9
MTCEDIVTDSLGLCVNRPCGNGTCTNNCVSFTCSCFSGYHGNLCEFECGYGTNCTKLCGQCKDGVGNCDHVTGVCSKGCDDWYIGNNCDIKCPEGICGTNCTEICREMTSTRNNQSQHCDECCALCLTDSEELEVTKAPHSSGKCSLEVYGLLAALKVSLLIHFGVFIMYFLRLRLNKKDILSGTTPMYVKFKIAESSVEHLNQEEQSTAEINIYYESLQNSASAQDIHNYASLGK